MKLILYATTFLLASLLACQKPTDAVRPVDRPSPSDTTKTTPTPPAHSGVVYDHGTPVGQATQTVIGPEGGTLASVDGTLTMRVPAGAVSKATTFSIQPVTPTLPGLLGGQAFRLLPEGQTFSQPITLQYHYRADSLDGTSAQALFMAYQDRDGYWKAQLNTELDATAQTLTVSTLHFSDWGAFAEYTLEATPDVLFAGQSSKLTLEGYWSDLVSPLTPGGVEVELTQKKTLENPDNIRNWQLMGKGGLNVGASRTSATYSAPVNLPQGSARVTVDVYNILPPNQQPRKGDVGKAVLMKTIQIGGTYFRVTINGQLSNCDDYYGVIGPTGISIGGGMSSSRVVVVNIHSLSLKPGTYSYSKIPLLGAADGKADVNLTEGGIAYVSWYDTCSDSDIIPSSGSVTIDAVEVINGMNYVRGSLSVTTYWITGNCPSRDIETRTIRAEFRVLVADL